MLGKKMVKYINLRYLFSLMLLLSFSVFLSSFALACNPPSAGECSGTPVESCTGLNSDVCEDHYNMYNNRQCYWSTCTQSGECREGSRCEGPCPEEFYVADCSQYDGDMSECAKYYQIENGEAKWCMYILNDEECVPSDKTCDLLCNLTINKTLIEGDLVVPLYTKVNWILNITVTNNGVYNQTNVTVKDTIPGEYYVVSTDPTDNVTITQTGSAHHITWKVGTLEPGESKTLLVNITTKKNPAGKQEFTTCGNYSLNEGAEVESDQCEAGPTEHIEVEVPCEEEPYCGDNIINQEWEECDGTDDQACPFLCQNDCTCLEVYPKIHFPHQYPNETGLDVNATFPERLADDWQCICDGNITDIHFWGSWKDDINGTINNIFLRVYTNIPEGPLGYSIPGVELWDCILYPEDFEITEFEPAIEGWYDPLLGLYLPEDHQKYHRIDVFDLSMCPLNQTNQTIYWLEISVNTTNGSWGWKTSNEHFMDDAVYWFDEIGTNLDWGELRDPMTEESLDLAFMVTGECEEEPYCGDNIINQEWEECDGTDDQACPGECQQDCTCPVIPPPYCGDGIINQEWEECEYGIPCPGGKFCDEYTCLCELQTIPEFTTIGIILGLLGIALVYILMIRKRH